MSLLIKWGEIKKGPPSEEFFNEQKGFLKTEFPPCSDNEAFLKSGRIQDIPVCYIEGELFEEMIMSNPYHPVYYSGQKFIGVLRDRPSIVYEFSCAPTKELADFLIKTLSPAMVSFHFIQLKTTNNINVFNRDFQDKKVDFGGGVHSSFIQYLIEITKIKDITMSLLSENLTGYKKFIPRSCHYIKCPYYEIGLCWKWKLIPEQDYKDCLFPAFFETFFRKRIDTEQKQLIPINASEAEIIGGKYLTMQHELMDKKQIRVTPLKERFFYVTMDRMNMLREDYFGSCLEFIRKYYSLSDLGGGNSFGF